MAEHLPMLEPPPGGLERLRERIAADDRRHAKLRWLAVPALAIAAVFVVWLARPRPHPSAPVASTLLRDPSIEGVAFYWVSPTTTAPTPQSSPAFVDVSAVTINP